MACQSAEVQPCLGLGSIIIYIAFQTAEFPASGLGLIIIYMKCQTAEFPGSGLGLIIMYMACQTAELTASRLGEAPQHGAGCSQGHAVLAHVPATHFAPGPQVCESACQQALESQGTLPHDLNTALCPPK